MPTNTFDRKITLTPEAVQKIIDLPVRPLPEKKVGNYEKDEKAERLLRECVERSRKNRP